MSKPFPGHHRDTTLDGIDLGFVWGIVGKLCFFTDGDWKLVVITEASSAGMLPQGGEVFCVDKIGIIPLNHSDEVIGFETPEPPEQQPTSGGGGVAGGVVHSSSVGARLKNLAMGSSSGGVGVAGGGAAGAADRDKSKELREREKVEKRLTEALLNMFNDSRSFYFCLDSDLTKSLQKQLEVTEEEKRVPLWQRMDDRFFWNKWMISELMDEQSNALELSGPWILPLIQGYMEVRQIPVLSEDTPNVLDPGWTDQYREERGKLLEECVQEMEMKELAGVASDRKLIPMKQLKHSPASGYETDSSDSGSESDDFSPIKFTSQLKSNGSTVVHHPVGQQSPVIVHTPYTTQQEKFGTTGPQETDDNTPQHHNSNNIKGSENREELDSDLSLSDGVDEVESGSNNQDCLALPTSSTSGKPIFYSTTETPDMGVVIDILGSRDSATANKDTQEISDNTCVSVTNPFLLNELEESESERPSWMRYTTTTSESTDKGEDPPTFTLAIISRRSRYRAGTRYKRRGVDESGNVANYVETELILKCGSHLVSYVIIRGSVPVYWSQTGGKRYRFLPVIERTPEETQEAFRKHFTEQLMLFKEMVAVNLVRQDGKEKCVGDAFEQQVLLMDDPLLTYVAYDFHRSYKGNQTLAALKLLDGTAEFLKKFKFCWIDSAQSSGPLCRQEGIFRINCMDCLDRTNVVESILSREILQTALQKLGVIPFDEKLGGSTLVSYQEMWANHGDTISKQYAGTAAMKGDITRYGERKISGIMKDGYTYAHRYYLNVFRDSYRQVLIDLMQGVNPFEAFSSLPRSLQGMDELDEDYSVVSSLTTQQAPSHVWSLARKEALEEMIEMCRKEIFPNDCTNPLTVTGWVLAEAPGYSFLGESKEESTCVVMHSMERAQLCVIKLNMEVKEIVCFIRIPMAKIERIVIGQLGLLLRSNKRLHMRLHYSLFPDTSPYFTFMTVNSTSVDEDRAILMSIAEMLATYQPSIAILEQKLNKKRCVAHTGIIYLSLPDAVSAGNKEDSLSREAKECRDNNGGVGEEEDDNDDDEKAPSVSAPTSPKLRHDLHRSRSHSADDLSTKALKSPSTSPSSSDAVQPSITVTSPAISTPKPKEREQQFVPNQEFDSSEEEEEEESDDGGLELELDLQNAGTPGRAKVGAVNPLVDILRAESSDSKRSDEDIEASSATGGGGGGSGGGGGGSGSGGLGKLNRLRGHFMQKVKSSRSAFMSGVRSLSPQPADTMASSSPSRESTAGSSSSKPGPSSSSPITILSEASGGEDVSRSPSKQLQPQQQLQVKSKSPPSLWRKMRRGSSPVGLTEEELSLEKARKSSRSRIIYL